MNTSQVSPDLERHTRKCSICRHPDRDAIEDEFLHWHRVIWIAQEFHIPDHRSIYRHARATGLIRARRENLHSALDNIVEQSDGIRASASDVLKAIRAYSCLDPSTGRWTEPPKQVALSYTIQKPSEPAEGSVPATGPGNASLPIGASDHASDRGFVGQGFSPDITEAAEDPSTSEAPSASPASASGGLMPPSAEAGMGSACEGGNYIAPGLENADKQSDPPDIATPALPAYTGPSPEERRFWDQLAGIDHRPYGRR